ncbi:hypothetical protein [Bacillus sp. BS98]|uniref:hypothetical protein n=1 Tax=Bacillus sp. BS98 TaxID=2608254 RepID=UPI00155AE2C0|nr:hypothetical protein [Bacillus sp. BS98]
MLKENFEKPQYDYDFFVFLLSNCENHKDLYRDLSDKIKTVRKVDDLMKKL